MPYKHQYGGIHICQHAQQNAPVGHVDEIQAKAGIVVMVDHGVDDNGNKKASQK